MRRALVPTFLLLCGAVLLVPGHIAEAGADEPVSVTDFRGKQIILPRPAERIICLLESALSGLYMLGAQERIIGISTNVRIQSGWPWAPTQSVSIPGSGTQRVFLDDIDQRRSDNVAIVDLRVEKAFNLGGNKRLTGMFDVYNMFNSNPETNFTIRTGNTFNNIIAVLDPRAIKLGIRFQF